MQQKINEKTGDILTKKYSGTSLWDTSTQGVQTLVSEKRPYNLFIRYLYWKDTRLFREKGHFFWVPKPKFNLHSEDTLGLKKWLSIKRVDIFNFELTTNVEAFTNLTISL